MESVMRGCAAIAAVVGVSLGIAACASDATGSNRSAVQCTAGQPQQCSCAGGALGMQVCAMDGASFATPCMCGGAGTPSGVAGAGSGGTPSAGTGGIGSSAGTGGIAMMGTGGMATMAGTGGMTMTGTGGMATMTGTGGRSGTGGNGGTGGMTMMGTGGMSAPATDLAELRQACVDYINMYRATVGRAPLERATPAQEECSDMGAKKDGDSGQAHSSAGDCPGLGAQNACPGYPVGSGDIAGIEKSLKGCLDQMWDEGEPPVPVDACIQDYQNCFLKYGHWINMTDESTRVVSCGFYEMPNGNYWMNQDFGR